MSMKVIEMVYNFRTHFYYGLNSVEFYGWL